MHTVGFAHLSNFFYPATQPGMLRIIRGCLNLYGSGGHDDECFSPGPNADRGDAENKSGTTQNYLIGQQNPVAFKSACAPKRCLSAKCCPFILSHLRTLFQRMMPIWFLNYVYGLRCKRSSVGTAQVMVAVVSSLFRSPATAELIRDERDRGFECNR
jgi:hypothetical protein